MPPDHRGAGLVIHAGLGPTPFGTALLAWTAAGVCRLTFETGSTRALLEELSRAWPQATIERDDAAAAQRLAPLFEASGAGEQPRLLLRGTPFQLRVWQALLQLPAGRTVRYAELASSLGAPRSARAVGTALAANSIGWLVPCHRVVPGSGGVGHYRWGSPRKMAMLVHEAEQRG